MMGAIAGDIVGSVYEAMPCKRKDFPLFRDDCSFTDDTVLTLAVANAILGDGDYQAAVLELGRAWPHAGYGASFFRWLHTDNPGPYNSWGNGAAMRVSPVGFAFDTEEDVLREAARSAAITHDHPEGIKGAQAVALAVWMARTGRDKPAIRHELETRFDYDLGRTLAAIRPEYRFDVSCQGSVPEAVIAFLESDSWEDAVRNAVSLGGDADTQACIAGGIAEAFYGPLDEATRARVLEFLAPPLRAIAERFERQFSTRS